MKKALYTCTLLLLISCGVENQKTENTITEDLTQSQIDSVLTDFRFEYNNPIYIDSTNQVLLPVTTKGQSSRKSFKSDSYYSSGPSTLYWNILFYNSKTEKTNLLTDKKMSISNFDYNLRETGKKISKSILYKIRSFDYNKDNKLDYKDPAYLYISNNDGTNLKRLSPKNETLESYSIIPETDQIIIQTKRDNNNDLKFNYEDELIWHKIDLNLNSKPVEIIDASKRKKIENLFFKQWLKKHRKNGKK